MTRLPELERELLRAAQALERKRRPWWRISLLGGGATLALAATAYGTAQLLLPEGDPVPKAPPAQRAGLPDMDPGSSRLTSLRAEDPEGGLPWGLVVSRSKDGNVFCAQVGRVQGGRLGVIGRDGTFDDDGRFHPLGVDANQSGSCAGIPPGGDLQMADDGPPIPASGFTGSFLSPAGGCREHVADPGASMSPQTRRKLRNVPVCEAGSLRVVKYGFAGRRAVEIEYGGQRVKANPDESGAYLFVLRPGKGKRTLTIEYDDGTICRSTFPRAASTVEPC